MKVNNPSYEIYIKEGNENDLKLLFNVVDKLRNEYGINVYVRFLEGGWLYGNLDDELKIIICGKEIRVRRTQYRKPEKVVDRLVDEILVNIGSLAKSVEEPLLSYQKGPGNFSSAEYLIAAAN